MKLVALVLVTGCGLSGSLDLPLISPPVRAATPPGLASTARNRPLGLDASLSASDLHDRFFSGNGPTDLMTVLGWIDQRIAEIDDSGTGPCLAAAPVDVPLGTIGETMTIAASCYRDFGDGFIELAVVGGTTSFYVTGGAVRMAAIVTPVGASDYQVDAWYGVGYTNVTSCGATGTFDDCSYGVTALHANSATKAFEMSVAGLGEGFCGVQLQSDGTSLYAIGSNDMGETCGDAATACVDATDLASPGACTPALTLPAIGRRAGAGAHVFGASHYPDAPNVTLDGTATDSLHFGPDAPAPGVAEL